MHKNEAIKDHTVGNMHFYHFITSVDTSTADQALQLAHKAIDAGAVQ
jgi:hypothetical protein